MTWKVYYGQNLWGQSRYRNREQAGEEIKIRKQAAWGEEILHIPAIYVCSRGWETDASIAVCRKQPSDKKPC